MTPPRVLVVDDEPSISRAMEIALTRAGYDAQAVTSGEAAIAILRARPVDVMLVDLRMPDMRGDVLFELAAATQPALRTQTVFMTGDITERAQQLIDACKCHYLRKPFDLRDMLAAVAAICPRRHDVSA